MTTPKATAAHPLGEAAGSTCSHCGMVTKSMREYHPYAACLMMKASGNGNAVEANLRAVVEYGMNAQKRGLSLDVVMRNIAALRRSNDKLCHGGQ